MMVINIEDVYFTCVQSFTASPGFLLNKCKQMFFMHFLPYFMGYILYVLLYMYTLIRYKRNLWVDEIKIGDGENENTY